jgi:3-hydroxymyristoyl/3-hydroxydecanoyl-(acyl carrier protein) dehydratase
MKNWLPLKNVEVTPEGLITAELVLDSGSGWFEGHFPSRPILPGVVFLAAVEKVLAQAGLQALLEVRKVKFLQIVSPDEKLTISLRPLSPGESHEVRFEFSTGDRLVCQGVARYEPPGSEPAAGTPTGS